MKAFCPNCEKETESELTCEVYSCGECGEDNGNYEKPSTNHWKTQASTEAEYIFELSSFLSHPMPMAFWTEKDVWDYINKYNLPYSRIYDMGYKRTGCMFCMYGIQSEPTPNRFQTMEKTHPKIYNYCIENLGIGNVLDFIGIEYKNDKS